MSGSPIPPKEFERRLQEALQRARDTAASQSPQAVSATSSQQTASAAPPQSPAQADGFSARLADALARSRGDAPVTEAATPAEEVLLDGPVGQGDYVVREGDCINSIAFEHGFFPDTLWEDPGNSELREAREDPDTLLPGDRVTIPELRRKDEDCPPEQRHRFKRKGYPKELAVQFLKKDDEPIANMPLTLDIDGGVSQGTTDAAGWLRHPISPNAQRAIIELENGATYTIALGGLSPVDTVRGVQERLYNMHMYDGPVDGEMNEEARMAIWVFQSSYGLEPTGHVDEATRNKLLRLAGE